MKLSGATQYTALNPTLAYIARLYCICLATVPVCLAHTLRDGQAELTWVADMMRKGYTIQINFTLTFITGPVITDVSPHQYVYTWVLLLYPHPHNIHSSNYMPQTECLYTNDMVRKGYTVDLREITVRNSPVWCNLRHLKPISQLLFDYTIRLYHDAFDSDGSDRNYDSTAIRLRQDCDEKLTC